MQGYDAVTMYRNRSIVQDLLRVLEDHTYDEAMPVFEDLAKESDPKAMVGQVLEIVRICGWDADYDDMVEEYFSLAENELNNQQYFHDGNSSLSEIYTEMIHDQYCWIGILYGLGYDASGYVSELIDALDGYSDDYEFCDAIDDMVCELRKGIDDGESGRWFMLSC